ncbi:MAG: hypothetical protein ACFFDN_00220 [Candidatus Hodarchaeota archaeon]
MKKHGLAFSFGVSLFTFLILLTENYYDRMLVELTTGDLLIFTLISTITGFITLFAFWGILIALKRGTLSDGPKIYNISGGLFLLFAIILYLYVRDIPLKVLSMSIFISIIAFYILPIVLVLFLLTRKISLILTFGTSIAVFLALLSVNYYDKMLSEVKTGDLLYFSIWSTIAGCIGAGLSFFLTERVGDFNLSGAFILIFAGLLFLHAGDALFKDIIMATFISVLTLFSFIFISGIFVIIMLFNYYKKTSRGT